MADVSPEGFAASNLRIIVAYSNDQLLWSRCNVTLPANFVHGCSGKELTREVCLTRTGLGPYIWLSPKVVCKSQA